MIYNKNHRPTLLAQDDTVVICDIRHIVMRGDRYWLHCYDLVHLNDHVFEIFGIDPMATAQRFYAENEYVVKDLFPETKDLKELTDLVNYLLDLDATQGVIDLSLLNLEAGVLSYNLIPLIQITRDGGIEKLKIEDFHNCPFGLDDDGFIVL